MRIFEILLIHISFFFYISLCFFQLLTLHNNIQRAKFLEKNSYFRAFCFIIPERFLNNNFLFFFFIFIFAFFCCCFFLFFLNSFSHSAVLRLNCEKGEGTNESLLACSFSISQTLLKMSLSLTRSPLLLARKTIFFSLKIKLII